MYAQLHTPDELPPETLDEYLARGWFRMGQSIFTTHFLNFNNTFYSAIWLRVELQKMKIDSSQDRLYKTNRGFGFEIKPAHITTEHEALFPTYKASVPFRASASIHQLLMGCAEEGSIYNTLEVNLYDGKKRVACGYFDLGERSAAGISSFYDPAYKRYSLGRYLIYLKLDYCRNLGLQYFYPGYFVPGYSYFDYKLKMGSNAQDFYSYAHDRWLPIKQFDAGDAPLQLMKIQLASLRERLEEASIPASFLHYDYFDVNLVREAQGMQLFDYPVFIRLATSVEGIGRLIVYEPRSGTFRLLGCTSIWSPEAVEGNAGHYVEHILRESMCQLETRESNEVIAFLKR